MKAALQATAMAFLTTLGMGSVSEAATVRSVDLSFLEFGGIIYEIEQAGNYTLDFSGMGLIPGAPNYLGFAAYIFAEVDGGLDELEETLEAGIDVSAFNGTSINLGFLNAGIDFAAGLLSAGNARMSLVRIDDQPAPVPLPATLPLLAAAIGAPGLAARRRNA
ncbi:hypothetical protein [Paracoccus sp. SSK6]|uniref:hypothetical protein n=1 Tax=Paracoccus sp. SSK6 TaxID=3143131 RepID=UPI0032198DEB